MYAAGKIPGSFFKREGRSGEKGTLVARMIDRPLRPLFPKGWHRETQLVSIPLSIDHVVPYDILAMNGASAALMVSNIPFPQPVGAVRIGKIDGNFVVNPNEEDLLTADLDLVVSGTDEAILMVEAGANEIPEAEILDALDIAHSEIKKLVAAMRELGEKAGKSPKLEVETPQVDEGLLRADQGLARAEARRGDLGRGQARPPGRHEGRRGGGPRAVLRARGRPEYARGRAARRSSRSTSSRSRSSASASRSRRSARTAAARTRSAPITIEAGLLPRTHGSALFTRGQTQALSVAALGTTREEMRLDTLGLETSKRYFHHYNFPPFSVGEAGFMRGPKRRDIGHGALAERALVPMIPSQEEFPYTIRVVSDILESNGSSSMASVCGSSLSLMDAGVPLKRPGRRHRHGPDQGGRRLRRAVRHRRRGGPPRRHGLQGRRHGERHHRAPDGHQDHGRDLRHPARRAHAGQGGAHVHPRQDGRGHRRAARASCRSTRRASRRSRSTRTRSAC